MPILAPADPYSPAVQRINLLGPDLLAARKRLKLTAGAQAAAIGISSTALAGITGGTTDPPRSTILRCLKWLAAHH